MIPYSVTMRPNPMNENDPKKAYASAQTIEVLDFDAFVRFVAEHQSKYDEADISAVMFIISKRIRELLLDGKKVSLGPFGDIWLSLNSKGAESIEAFTQNNILDINILFTPGRFLNNLRPDATFFEVPIRRHQESLMDAVNEGLSVVNLDDHASPHQTSAHTSMLADG